MKNNELKTYDFIEGANFDGLMPKAANKIGLIGGSSVSVKHHGFDAKGVDALEVADINGIWENDVTNEEPEVNVEPDFTQNEVILTSDYAPATPVIINGNETNVNLNGNKVIAPIFAESNGEVVEGDSDSYGFWIKDGSLTIEGDGEVIAQDANYSMAVWANGGNVTIKGGIFRNGGDSCDLIYASAGGNVIIEGGEFFPAGPASGTAPGTKNPYTALNVKDKDYKSGVSTIVVKGGKFHNFNPADNVSEGEHTNFVAEGYKSVEVEPDVWEVMPE